MSPPENVTFTILKTSNVPNIPKDVTILHNFGYISIQLDDGNEYEGFHITIRCDKEVVYRWLGRIDGFLLGVGKPFEQRFKVIDAQYLISE